MSEDDGVLVAGPNAAVAAVVAQLESVGGSGIVRLGSLATDAMAVLASGFADGATSVQYIRHTAGSTQLLREFGAIPAEGGSYRSFVKDAGRFTGNLDWQVVDIGPERVLAFQSAAIGLALRTAVNQVEVAVERIEDKVDRIVTLLRAERLGDILGDRRALESLTGRVEAGDGLSTADWSSVAALGPAVTRDLEKLRAHVRLQLADGEAGWRPRARASAAKDLLTEDLIVETLALIVVAEDSFSMWQQLRIEHIRSHEPDHLASGVTHARQVMREHLDQDQLVLDQLRSWQRRLLEPAAMDGLAPFQIRRLDAAGRDLEVPVAWFAGQGLLELAPLELLPRPGVRDSLRHLGTKTIEVARSAKGAIRRRGDDPQPELPNGTERGKAADH